MTKEDKYSLGYVICNSIQNNKDKIEKLENQLKRCRRKKEQVENKCGEYKYRIDKAIELEEEIMYLANKTAITTQNMEVRAVRDRLKDIFEILKGNSNE